MAWLSLCRLGNQSNRRGAAAAEAAIAAVIEAAEEKVLLQTALISSSLEINGTERSHSSRTVHKSRQGNRKATLILTKSRKGILYCKYKDAQTRSNGFLNV